MVEETGLSPREDTGCRVAVSSSNPYMLTVRERRVPWGGWVLLDGDGIAMLLAIMGSDAS